MERGQCPQALLYWRDRVSIKEQKVENWEPGPSLHWKWKQCRISLLFGKGVSGPGDHFSLLSVQVPKLKARSLIWDSCLTSVLLSRKNCLRKIYKKFLHAYTKVFPGVVLKLRLLSLVPPCLYFKPVSSVASRLCFCPLQKSHGSIYVMGEIAVNQLVWFYRCSSTNWTLCFSLYIWLQCR